MTTLPASVQDQFVTIDGQRVRYRRQGAGRTLLTLHGLDRSRDFLHAQAR